VVSEPSFTKVGSLAFCAKPLSMSSYDSQLLLEFRHASAYLALCALLFAISST